MATGQAPLGWVWLSLAALAVALLFIQSGATARPAAWRGWSVGLGYFMASLFWIIEPFLIDVARHGWMAPFALVFMSGGLALFWAAAGSLAARGPWALIAGFALVELARGYVLTGFPWALLGYIWWDQPQAQLASLVGPFGLTLMTLVAAGLPAVLGRQRALIGMVCGLAICAVVGIWGQVQTLQPAPAGRDPAIRVRLLQPNAPQDMKWDTEHIATFFDRQVQMTAQAPLGVDLIVWPETSFPYRLQGAETALRLIARAAGGRPVVIGATRVMEDGSARNAAVVLGSEGQIVATYDKYHLVPFGEYLPFADFFNGLGLYGLAEAAGGYSPGSGAQLLNLGPLGNVLPLICYEAIFPQDLRAAPSRPDWVLQITNDAWFGALAGPQQHLAQAQFRAIEQGLPVLRSANTGISAVIDPWGRVVDSLPLNTTGALDVVVPAPLPPTIYARIGDIPTLLAGLVLLAGAVARTRRKPVDAARGAT